MILQGKLYAETPIYQGNAKKTMFTRDGDGKYKLVSLAGEIEGTAQALMDAFTGQSRNGKNIGLLERLWKRLYGEDMPRGLVRNVECKLREECYPRDKFFDMRMGIKLDEDRWAAESNANYKMEAIFKNSVFNFSMTLNDSTLKRDNTTEKLYFLLQEIMESRFWFGAGKSKGLGRVRLEANLPFEPKSVPVLHKDANHLRIDFSFDSSNPVLVGWNWGKVDPHTPSFLSMDAGLLLENMTDIPSVIRERLKMSIGGSILNPDEWKSKFSEYFPRSVAIWLKEESEAEIDAWMLPSASLKKMSKGKYAINKKLAAQLTPLVDKPFPSKEEAEETFTEIAGKTAANMTKRILKELVQERQLQQSLNQKAWLLIAENFGFDDKLESKVSDAIRDEAALTKIIAPACKNIENRLFQQVDQQLKLLQSDSWVDVEIQSREEHLKIKNMLLDGKIGESQWSNPQMPPEGIKLSSWKDFLRDHSRVAYRHMLNSTNLRKSITNDENQIDFLKAHRDKTRLELAKPEHIDFRSGGPSGRHISKEYGKPYDTVFMRMLSWAPSQKEQGSWEIYIPGGTIKGAFRKRASQMLKTLWGETKKTAFILDDLFGVQGKRGMVFFSDAYLVDPDDSGNWCSMDGVRMDPATGQPVETSKADYLFAYGDKLKFKFQIDIQDINTKNMPAVSVLFHLINDFRLGDIPLGGEKTSGFGWVEANIARLQWLAPGSNGIHQKLFNNQPLTSSGLWQVLDKRGDEAGKLITNIDPILPDSQYTNNIPHAPGAGFVSHRAFGGYCGQLTVEAKLLTPMNIKESGEPSFSVEVAGERLNGHDFYSISPPEAGQRSANAKMTYALPGRSVKGMVRHIYTIASNSHAESMDISRLNPVDSLFGWVGNGPNQALMGRLVFDFAKFEEPELGWFKVPYPYGEWRYADSGWQKKAGGHAAMHLVADKWRIFSHAPLAPVVQQMETFAPDEVNARYFRAMLPGNKARFTIRFWNLEESEFHRLLWSLELEPGLAHKMGNTRYLGFGSLRFSILPESYLIDWTKRYADNSMSNWRIPLDIDMKAAIKSVQNYSALKKALNAEHI
ncbi:hypothetical protein MTBBW1_1040067 [Desulfamplus magnetovallimortis]|uniref:CRISPR type III-associated protein domain-containing protein n=1 Tax=Desulfamplus magnetovallimortis TaxID=1246637 RepID=A0A1W1H556_9BACT|nr:RAMP superfamily CRISPR-associated protein [Desulfamplus magnetovallimortis]SLM27610.1 hypothetical protein MTBBW1_1040067 [Desulfamplus magnetovallimortis]